MAKKNAISNTVSQKCEFLCGDITRDLPNRKFDMIVSNPPYIAEDEKESLSSEVLCEPKTALFAEENGLLFYRKIAENFKQYSNFTLMFEIGYSQSKLVSVYLAENDYKNIQTIKDYNGLDRVIISNK